MKKQKSVKEIKLELLDTIYSDLKSERVKEIDSFIQLLNTTIEKNNLPIKLKVGGSYAKKTYLGNDFDVDIFLRVTDKNIQDVADNFIKLLPVKANKVHGSRDYYQIFKNNIKYELVPNKYIENLEEAINTTDYSPFHVDFLKDQMKLNKNLNDEIRLAKLFLKAANCYGAESYINSFSGHSLDVLVSFFKTFEDTIQFISNINTKKKYLIDISGFYDDKYKKSIDFTISKEDFKDINNKFENKINSSLIIIDPINKNRIASSALRNYRLEKLKFYSKLFLDNPNISFFKKDIKFNSNRHNLILSYRKDNENMDMCGANVLAIKRRLSIFLKENGFEVIDNYDFTRRNKRNMKNFNSEYEDIYYENNVFYLKIILKNKKLKRVKILQGPLLDKEESVKRFRSTHKKTFVKVVNKKEYLYAKEKRKVRKLNFFVDNFFLKRSSIEKYVKRF